MSSEAALAPSGLDLAALRSVAERYREQRDPASLDLLRAGRIAFADFILSSSPEVAQRYWTAAAKTELRAADSPRHAPPSGRSVPRWWRRLLGAPIAEAAPPASPPDVPFAELHALFMGAGLRDLTASEADRACMARIRTTLQPDFDGRMPGTVERGAMAAMLFAYAHEFPTGPGLEVIAEWFRADYLVWLLAMPSQFRLVGEADLYLRHLQHTVADVHALAMCRPRHAAAAQVAAIFAGASNFVQAYFNPANLRAMMAKRGDIIATALLHEGRWLLSAFVPRHPGGKIRLGILARHFSPQTDTYFALSHFEHIDRHRFDITLFAMERSDHPLEQHCFAAADRVVILPARDMALQAACIRAADLDILLFGSNVTAVVNGEAALGAHRLARLQVATVSSPVTTGLATMDVMLSAAWNEPEQDAQAHYTEWLHCMPGGLGTYAFRHDHDPATVEMSRAALGLGNDQLVFFSGANFYKIVPELVESWARILAALPDSVLLLMPFNPSWAGDYQASPFMERICRQMEAAGVARSRLKALAPVPARADLHRVLALADIYLDAHPFAGACSMLDPLQAGVPPVAWYGQTARSRHGYALLRSVGLEDLAADSVGGFERKALQLAGDSAWRARVREQLLAQRQGAAPPPYLDTAAFSAKVGHALSELFEDCRRRTDRLRGLDESALRERVQVLSDQLVGCRPELDNLTDEWIARHLCLPYLQSLDRGGRSPLLLDVGACYGSMAMPFLDAGWSAVLFEPDSDARRVLETNVAPHVARCRVVAAAVDSAASASVRFYKSDTAGLSGLSASPYGSTQQEIEVPAIRLADFCREAGVQAVDLLKIDAEGHDFDVLRGFDFELLQPALVLVEFGDQFPGQSLADVDANLNRMRSHGYGAVAFCYTDDGAFKRGEWSYRLAGLCTDVESISRVNSRHGQGAAAFGNIIFYRVSDHSILLMLIEMLEGCLPHRDFGSAMASGMVSLPGSEDGEPSSSAETFKP